MNTVQNAVTTVL